MKNKFDIKRLFFPLCYYHMVRNGNEFNAFVFYVDVLIWTAILATLVIIII